MSFIAYGSVTLFRKGDNFYISVVQVNPYAVKQTKEVEDNSQLKDDRKNPKLIANLVHRFLIN